MSKTLNEALVEDEATEAIVVEKPRMNKIQFENTLKILFNVFKEKYNHDLDAEINLPRIISGKKSMFYILFLKLEDGRALPLLRLQDELNEENTEANMYYTCLETSLRLLTDDNIIKEILDKARAAEQQLQDQLAGANLPQQSSGPEGTKDATDGAGGIPSGNVLETKTKKSDKSK